MTIFLIFLFGLCFGSFLNALIYRMENEESILYDRSHCPSCKKNLAWHELIPVLSFVLQRAKCRGCNGKISFQYPLVELLVAAFFVFVYFYLGSFSVEFFYLALVIFLLILIFVFDIKHYIIPNKAVFSLIVVSLLYDLYSVGFSYQLFYYFLAALVASGFFLALFLFSSGRWIGFGDVKFGVFMGLFLGIPNIFVALFLAYIIGALIGLLLLALKRKGLKSEVPFGPFLVIGSFLAYFWGMEIINWYIRLSL